MSATTSLVAFNGLALLFAAWMLVRHGRRGLLFVAPGLVRVGGDREAPPATPGQLRAGEELARLGFTRLGAKREDGPLGGLHLGTDAWANEREGAFADVFDHAPRRGGPAWVYFVSPFADGALVLTANHPRLALSTDRLLTGGLPGSSLEATFAAHRKAVERFAGRHGAPAAPADLAVRLELARAWYRGPGRRELRRLFLVHFVNALAALALAGASARYLSRALGTQ
jgi:hypothetical protein